MVKESLERVSVGTTDVASFFQKRSFTPRADGGKRRARDREIPGGPFLGSGPSGWVGKAALRRKEGAVRSVPQRATAQGPRGLERDCECDSGDEAQTFCKAPWTELSPLSI